MKEDKPKITSNFIDTGMVKHYTMLQDIIYSVLCAIGNPIENTGIFDWAKYAAKEITDNLLENFDIKIKGEVKNE